MRKQLTRTVLVLTAVAAMMQFAPSAHAMVCNDNFPDPETGQTTCFVLNTVIAPVCRNHCG